MRIETYMQGSSPPRKEGSNIFHSNVFFHLVEKTPGVEPFLLVAWEDEEIVARMLAVIKRDFRLFPPAYFHWCTVYGTGEYFGNKERQATLFPQMLRHLTQIMNKRCFIIDFRNIEGTLTGYRDFRLNSFIPLNWLRVYNSLHNRTPEESVNRQYRLYIKKALESGVVTGVAKSEEEIRQTLIMLKNNYISKIEKYFPRLDFFYQLLTLNNEEKETARIFCVKYQNKIIGGAVCAFSSDRAYLLFSGGLRKSYPLQHPGIMAVWQALCYAHERGYSHFEFFDAGLPYRRGVGFLRFIISFGGKQVSTRRWVRISWRWLNKILEKIYV